MKIEFYKGFVLGIVYEAEALYICLGPLSIIFYL
jgi:hypothetical protein